MNVRYRNRLDIDNTEQCRTSFAAKYRDEFIKKYGTFPPESRNLRLLKPLFDFDYDANSMYSNAMPKNRIYEVPQRLAHDYLVSSYVLHLDANTQPQLNYQNVQI